jgi:hypothetical protein
VYAQYLASTDAVRVSPNPVCAACVRGVLVYLSDRDVCGRVCCGDLLCVCGLLWFFLLSLPESGSFCSVMSVSRGIAIECWRSAGFACGGWCDWSALVRSIGVCSIVWGLVASLCAWCVASVAALRLHLVLVSE